MTNSNTSLQSLPWTGERYLPEVDGNIELEHIHRYVFAKQFLEGKRVLDIASGEGYGSALLAQNSMSVIGVDISSDAVAHANTKYKADNLEFKVGSCAAIPLLDHSVDVVVSFETIEHHEEHAAMMCEIKRVLIPGGLLIISSPDKLEYSDKTGYDNPYHVKELYREEFVSLLHIYFKHHLIAGQKLVYGSAIFEEDASSIIKSYDLTDNSLFGFQGIQHALYLIAIASDGDLPTVESSTLEQPISESDEAKDYIRQLVEFNESLVDRDHRIFDLEASIGELQQKLSLMAQEYNQIVNWTKDLNQAIVDRDHKIADLDLAMSKLSLVRRVLTGIKRLYKVLKF